jgi:uncharacterized protein (TIGR02246 family)
MNSNTTDLAAIRHFYEDWPRAAEAGDVRNYLAFVTDDVVVMPPGQETIQGKEALEAWLGRSFGQARFRVTLDPPDEVRILGDWAFVRYAARLDVEPKAGGDAFPVHRRYLDVLRRESGGWWKAYCHMWNEPA